MRKYSFLLTLVTISTLFGLLSCKKNNVAVDVDPLNVPARSRFAYYDATAPVAKTFYVGAAAPANVYNVPVGITNVANVDRTVQFTYSSTTAVAGTHYTAPVSVVIPAGQALAQLPITGMFANIPAGVAHVLKIKITGGDVPAFGSGRDSVLLTLRRYCPVVIASLAGAYNNTNEYTTAGAFSYGPYATQVTNLVSTGATTATGKIVNLYDDGWVDVNVTLDWTDPANFKLTIPYQTTGKIYSGTAPTFVRTSTAAAAVNTFSSCDRSFSFGIDLVNSGTGAVLTANYKFVMK
jgi:hypothetical protein